MMKRLHFVETKFRPLALIFTKYKATTYDTFARI